jgi:hypothetical protein
MEITDEMNEWSKKNLERTLDLFQKCGYLYQKKSPINDEVDGKKPNVIKQDDILNLKIALENCNSVEDFLKGI